MMRRAAIGNGSACAMCGRERVVMGDARGCRSEVQCRAPWFAAGKGAASERTQLVLSALESVRSFPLQPTNLHCTNTAAGTRKTHNCMLSFRFIMFPLPSLRPTRPVFAVKE
jgi:hypothetical protein